MQKRSACDGRFIASFIVAGLLLAACEKKTTSSSQAINRSPVPSNSPEAKPEPTLSQAIPITPGSANPAPSPSPASDSAAERPQFKSRSANEFVENYDAFIADFKVAYGAMKHRDMTKYEAVILRAQELESRGEKLENELSRDEQKQFADYLDRRADDLAELTKPN